MSQSLQSHYKSPNHWREAHGDKKGGTPQDGVKTDKGKILKVSWDGSVDSYNAAKLEELFQKFGKVEDIVIKTRKSRSKGSAVVVMGSKETVHGEIHDKFGVVIQRANQILKSYQATSY
ncbi:unnamed protein product [Miscanthus lutarioriparius]|uniref:RRM domain-containing protein n=1 Tax=Miscanthus lutarioriparius TaxID=422564 RepID=A0A811Q1S9_9POAL|nr:unnamed protein product [Miscanthus lutarioriparius]